MKAIPYFIAGGLFVFSSCEREEVQKPDSDMNLLTQSKWFAYLEVKSMTLEGEMHRYTDTLRYSFQSDSTFIEEATVERTIIGGDVAKRTWGPAARQGRYRIQGKDRVTLSFPQVDRWSPASKADTVKEFWRILKLSPEELTVIREKSGFETTLTFEGKKK